MNIHEVKVKNEISGRHYVKDFQTIGNIMVGKFFGRQVDNTSEVVELSTSWSLITIYPNNEYSYLYSH